MTKKYKIYSRKNICKTKYFLKLPQELLEAIKIVSDVFPFRLNNYIIDELIEWDNVPEDPIFQLTVPHQEMLDRDDFEYLTELYRKKASKKQINSAIQSIQMRLNPHPAGQMEMNLPIEDGKFFHGMQHKYNETVLFFPSQGQTCHAYCTYCFRWPQFVGINNLKFANNNIDSLLYYVNMHPEITDVLFTGGDPLFMSTNLISQYVEPLLKQKSTNINTIRFGTKSIAYWPYRFLTDKDSDDLMRLFEKIVKQGFHLSIMAHFSHIKELETDAAQKAIKRILSTGAVIRCQAPLIKHINDDYRVWRDMWKKQVQLGAIPYYMFIERDTGAKNYFELPLAKAYEIFTKAYSTISGLCRTVRGPSMSAMPGKILIDGISEINGQKVFILKFIQARDSQWVNKTFFAVYDNQATWLNYLKPAFGAKEFFFTKKLEQITMEKHLLIDQVLKRSA